MGHRSDQDGSQTTEGYAKFDPKFMGKARQAIDAHEFGTAVLKAANDS